MRTFYLTDVGKIRSHNEDSVTILKNNSNEYLLVVADGMGGHRKGEVASQLVVNYLAKVFSSMDTIGDKANAITYAAKALSLSVTTILIISVLLIVVTEILFFKPEIE